MLRIDEDGEIQLSIGSHRPSNIVLLIIVHVLPIVHVSELCSGVSKMTIENVMEPHGLWNWHTRLEHFVTKSSLTPDLIPETTAAPNHDSRHQSHKVAVVFSL